MDKAYQETFSYKLKEMFSFLVPETPPEPEFTSCGHEIAASKATPAQIKEMELDMKMKSLKKLLATNDEMKRIRRGKALWATVRRKRRVISMMAKMGESVIFDLDKSRIKEQEK